MHATLQQPPADTDSDEHDTQPGEEWHVIFGRRFVSHQSDPIEQWQIEQRHANRDASDDHDDTDHQRRTRKSHQRPAEDRRDHDAVEDAEGDEGFRKRDVAADRDQYRARGDQRDPIPEPLRRNTCARGQNETDADEEEEAADDKVAKAEPETVMIEVGADDMKPVEIERGVIDDHHANRRAAQCVDGADSRQRLSNSARDGRVGGSGRGRACGGDMTAGFAAREAACFAASGPAAVALSPAHRPGAGQATRKPPEPSADPNIDKAVVIALERSTSSPALGFSRASTRAAPVAARISVPVISMSPPTLDSAPFISPPLPTPSRRRSPSAMRTSARGPGRLAPCQRAMNPPSNNPRRIAKASARRSTVPPAAVTAAGASATRSNASAGNATAKRRSAKSSEPRSNVDGDDSAASRASVPLKRERRSGIASMCHCTGTRAAYGKRINAPEPFQIVPAASATRIRPPVSESSCRSTSVAGASIATAAASRQAAAATTSSDRMLSAQPRTSFRRAPDPARH